MSTAIEFNNVSKQYKLGLVSTKTLSHDLNRWWQTKILGKEDPYLKIGSVNDRSAKADSDYVWALKDIDFKVEQGDVVGIIGKNGAGKSTLLKLLSRVTNPTTGTIRARGRIASLLEVGTGFHPELTGRENIYMNGSIMGMTKPEITRKLDEIVDFSGCERYIDTPVKRYSSGMMVRLGFAVAAHLDPEILVVDEVLAVGDAEFQKKAIGKMQDVSRGEGRTVLFVSHNMASIRQLCKSGVLLEKGRVKFLGNIIETIDSYINDGNATSSIYIPQNNIVKKISAEQKGDAIKLTLEYDSPYIIKQPNFGWVLYDCNRIPLIGTNPLKSGVMDFGIPKKSGKIEVYINSPKLVDGKYIIGCWFSDGNSNHFFSNDNCLLLNLDAMDLRTISKTTSEEGFIVPDCNWIFNC